MRLFNKGFNITDEMLRNHYEFVKSYHNDDGDLYDVYKSKRIVIVAKVISEQRFISENLSLAWFENCEFKNVDFKYANLNGAFFIGCTFKNCNFKHSNCYAARFENCNFDKNTNFELAVLVNTSFKESNIGECITNLPLYCPSDGEFIAWKKAYSFEAHKSVIVKLFIPSDAKRLSGCGIKCRVDKALVLDIQSIDGEKHYNSAESWYCDFKYTVGEWAKPEREFENDRFKTCASGIHIFISTFITAIHHKKRNFWFEAK